MDIEERIYSYIKDNQSSSLCDYIEIRDSLGLTDTDMHIHLTKLVQENRVKPNIGGYTLI